MVLPQMRTREYVFLVLFFVFAVLLAHNTYMLYHWGIFLEKPVSLLKKGTSEFVYRQPSEASYDVCLFVHSTQKWSKRQPEEATKIRLAVLNSLTFKMVAKVYQGDHVVAQRTVDLPRDNLLVYDENGPYFKLVGYDLPGGPQSKDIRLVLNVLEPETGRFIFVLRRQGSKEEGTACLNIAINHCYHLCSSICGSCARPL